LENNDVIKVAVRLRPLWQKEVEKDELDIVRILDKKVNY
jgi:hypothetical protein